MRCADDMDRSSSVKLLTHSDDCCTNVDALLPAARVGSCAGAGAVTVARERLLLLPTIAKFSALLWAGNDGAMLLVVDGGCCWTKLDETGFP